MFTASRLVLGRATAMAGRNSFHTTGRRMNDSAPLAAKKPMGAFRGGLVASCLSSTSVGFVGFNRRIEENTRFDKDENADNARIDCLASFSAPFWPAAASTHTCCRSTRHPTTCWLKIYTYVVLQVYFSGWEYG